MDKQYFASQYMLMRAFHNATNTLKSTSQYTSQDYLRAVFDPEKDAFRVNVAGGMLPPVADVSELPATAEIEQLCPVISPEGRITFYRYTGTGWERCVCGDGGSDLPEDQLIAIAWLTENLDRVKEVVDWDYGVREEIIVLDPNSTVVTVQGETQDIDDNGNTDGDADTPYRIDMTGYVLGLETYAAQADALPSRYYTKVVYEAKGSGPGVSHIFLSREEFDFFAALGEGKNVLRAHWLENVFPSSLHITEVQYEFPRDGEAMAPDGAGGYLPVESDSGDADDDPTTVYRLRVPGYALDMEAYFRQEDPVRTKCFVKMSYDAASAQTDVFLDREQYDTIAALTDGKNVASVFTLAEVKRYQSESEAIAELRAEVAALKAKVGA